MQQAIPSQTALRVALRRAAHQLHDEPLVFADPVAVPILGATYAGELGRTPLREDRPYSISMRAYLVARSRYAEEALARAVASGVNQYVLLGAGLDTFAHRNPWPQLRVYEVDHPATQAWKQTLLTANTITLPENLIYAPVDFETQSLPEQLQQAGFDSRGPAFFAWLGVVPYLTLPAFRSTIGFVAGRPAGSGIALDYGQPRASLSYIDQLAHDSLAERVRLAGEPFRLFFTPAEIAAELSAFHSLEDIGRDEINARYFAGRSDQLQIRSGAGHFLSAWI